MFGSLIRELWRVFLFNFKSPLFLATNAVADAMWFLVVILAVAWYGGSIVETARLLFWGSLALMMFSTQTWGAAMFSNYVRSGIMDYVAVTPERLHVFLISTSVAMAAAAAPGITVQYAVYYLVFGEIPLPAQPMYFAVSLAVFIFASACITSLSILFFIKLRNPVVAANVIQWGIPLSGGMIPPTAMSPEVARWFLYSPFHYVVAPLVYSAMGIWLLDPILMLLIGVLITAAFYMSSIYAARSALSKYRRVGKWGAEL